LGQSAAVQIWAAVAAAAGYGRANMLRMGGASPSHPPAIRLWYYYRPCSQPATYPQLATTIEKVKTQKWPSKN
jgi:hypothetical protein